ncbi:MAG: 30S ribosomal protein S12 methylthiotransferase RimO [Candidatus Bipolaricaulia bacterium]
MKSRPKIHLASLGCAKNLIDSERLLARLAMAGGLVGAAAEEADVIIVNTCGFIAPARAESLQTIRSLATHKAEDPTRKLLVVGCLVERGAEELRAALPAVDGFFGLERQAEIVAACGLRAEDDDDARLLLTPSHSAYLRISEGCDNCCSYCTIPLIRGRFRSRNPDDVLREARLLVDGGVRELNVIGQDTTNYGSDLTEPYPVHRLLNDLARIEDLRWLRLLYAHPAHFSDELIDAFAGTSNLCSYVDLPLQHLDDEILARMGRRVTQAESLRLIETLRSRVPGIAIRTTFILGFPGETEAQFGALLGLVRELRFDHLGAFAYSREPGTPAADFPNQISEAERNRRVRDLMLAQQEIAFAKGREKIGDRCEVLVDGETEDPGVWIGRTRIQAPDVDSVTFVRGEGLQAGQFLNVRITDTDGYDLIAEPAN